ncbi:MAG: hypothetical protein V3R77_05000, partial [Candidatus Binatia bacterium]
PAQSRGASDYVPRRPEATALYVEQDPSRLNNPTPEVVDAARWLVCGGCHDVTTAPGHTNHVGDLMSCADYYCHHSEGPDIHDTGQE